MQFMFSAMLLSVYIQVDRGSVVHYVRLFCFLIHVPFVVVSPGQAETDARSFIHMTTAVFRPSKRSGDVVERKHSQVSRD